MLSKIIAGLSGIIGFLLILLKLKSHKIENLEEENAGHIKKIEIKEEIKAVETKAEEIEEDAKTDINDSNWRNSI